MPDKCDASNYFNIIKAFIVWGEGRPPATQDTDKKKRSTILPVPNRDFYPPSRPPPPRLPVNTTTPPSILGSYAARQVQQGEAICDNNKDTYTYTCTYNT